MRAHMRTAAAYDGDTGKRQAAAWCSGGGCRIHGFQFTTPQLFKRNGDAQTHCKACSFWLHVPHDQHTRTLAPGLALSYL